VAAALLAPAAGAQGPITPGGDVVTSDNVEHLGTFRQLGDGVGARVIGNILYATSTTGLFVFDITDPAKPKHLGTMTADVEFENTDVPTNGGLEARADPFGPRPPHPVGYPAGQPRTGDDRRRGRSTSYMRPA